MSHLFRFQQTKQKIGVVSKGRKDVLERLQNFLNQELLEPMELLIDFWQNQQDAMSHQEIKNFIIKEEWKEEMLSFWVQDYSYFISNHMSNWWKDAIKMGANDQTFFSGVMKKGFHSDPVSRNILNYIHNHGGEFITNISNEQREAIKGLLTRSVIQEHSIDELANAIRPCIGLNARQATANLNYYDHVKESLTKAHPRMKASSIERKAREAADKYAKKQHRYRAKMIAQTELAKAYNYGADMAAEQAFQNGYLGRFERIWCTAADENVCSECNLLNGTKVAKGILPPLHPFCCCAIQYVEVEKPAILPNITSVHNVDFLEAAGTELLSEQEKGNLEKELSLIPQSHRDIIKQELKSMQIIQEGNSRYNRENGILYLRYDFEKGEVIHELAHIIESQLGIWIDGGFIESIKVTFGGENPLMYWINDEETFVKPIQRLNWNEKLLSEYQGRIYEEIGAVNENFEFNYYSLGDFFSEAYKYYLIDIEYLKEKQPAVYEYIEKLLE